MLLSKLFQENNSTPFKGRDVVLSAAPTKQPFESVFTLLLFLLLRSNHQTQLLQGARHTMKFKKGNAVEVLKGNEQCQTWFPGTILLADVHKCIVRYDRFLNHEGDPVVEEVSDENVRPNPPPAKGGERWVVGDKVEVFDLHCWKVGKIVKVLSNDRFVIRLSGSIQLKEFQRFDLRIQYAWRNNTWVLTHKVGDKIVSSKSTKGYVKEKNGGQNVQNSKRKNGNNFKFSREDVIIGKRSPWLRQVDVISSPRKKQGKKSTIKSTEESNECSVASCSTNGPLEYTSHHMRKSRNTCPKAYNDAESVCPSESEGRASPCYDEVELEGDVHSLELHAYKLTMHALYASGPLSWEQESLLTNLRLSLHISNEEHLVNLKQLLSTQVC